MKQKTTKRNLMFGLTLTLFATGMSAQTFTRDEITYSIVSRDKKTCRIESVTAAVPATLVISDSVKFGTSNYGVIGIGEKAFDLATGLTTLTLPSTLQYIENGAFFKPTKLKTINSLAVTPPDIESSPFATTILSNVTLNVPDGTWLDYCMSWRRFCRIYEIGAGKDYTIDGVKYRTLSLKDKYVGITGNNPKYSGDINVPAEVEIEGSKYKVVEVGCYAFDGCTALNSVVLPETILGINDYAFRKSTIKALDLPADLRFIHQGAFNAAPELESIVIPSKITRIENIIFQNAPKLKTVTIPSSVTFLGPSTFAGCTGLTDVIGGENLTFISSGCFNGATSLTGFKFSENVDSIETKAFYGTGINFTEIPKKIRVLPSYAFQQCYNLKNVVMGDQVVEIGSNVFSECKSLEKIRMSNNIRKMSTNCFLKDSLLSEVIWEKIPMTTFPSYTFSGCVSLKSFVLPEGIQIIGNGAFQGCQSMTEIKLPSTLTGIAINGFYNSGLTEVEVPEGVTQMGVRVFAMCANLKKAVLPNSIKEISQSTFASCPSLTEVTFGKDVTAFMPQVFQDCTGLKTIKLPAKLATIGKQCFYNCAALEEIVIPDSVNKIDAKCFTGCEALKNVISLPMVPPVIVDDTFDQTTYDTATLNVPEGTFDAYHAATGWKLFKKGQTEVEEVEVGTAEEIYGAVGEIIAPEGAEVYNMQGIKTGMKNLVPGMYIVRTAENIRKVLVK